MAVFTTEAERAELFSVDEEKSKLDARLLLIERRDFRQNVKLI